MIRTKILEDVRTWLTENNFNLSMNEIINEYKMDNITFSEEEINAIDEMFIDEQERRYEEQAEMERELESLALEWEAERKLQEREYRSMVGVA